MKREEALGLLLTFARRGEDDTVRRAVAHIRQQGATDVLAVGTPVSAPALRVVGADDILAYGDGAGTRAVIRDLRRRRPRLAVIVYLDASFAGHLKLEALALLSGAKRVWRAAPEGPPTAIGRAGLSSSVLDKSVRAFGCVLAGMSICTIAFTCLRARQLVAGGRRANRA